MTGWQESYKKELKDKTIEELKNIQLAKTREIERLDKRTRNGKMSKIFIHAEILAIQELIEEKSTYDLYERKNLTAADLREGYREITGLDNDWQFTADEIYAYLLDALKETEEA